jgi:hypothetical protein
MSTIVTRADKDSPLTNTEVDANFTNLNDDKVEKSGDTLTGDLAFGDNVKAKFGVSDDLEIYHDGSGSYITEQGTGNLRISGTNLNLQSTAGEIYLRAINNGEVDIRYDNAIKLATTSTGIDVTGTVTADGLTVDGGGTFQGSSTQIDLIETDIADNNTRLRQTVGDFFIQTVSDDKATIVGRLNLDHATGDISFYNDTGTSQNFYWDASTSRLGIKTTSPSFDLHVKGNVNEAAQMSIQAAQRTGSDGASSASLKLETVARGGGANRDTRYEFLMTPNNNYGNAYLTLKYRNDGINGPDVLNVKPSGDIEFFAQDGTTADFYWDKSTSRLGLGTTSPASPLQVDRASTDGNIVTLSKDGSTVGSIGTVFSDLCIGTGDTGIRFWDAGPGIFPVDPSNTFANKDNAIDLGLSSVRWKDLYLSGGVYLGGTGAANLLDDYEEGAWTPTLAFGGASTGITYTSRDGHYIKIGKQVTLHGSIILSSKGSSTGAATVESLPFTVGDNLSGTTLEAGGIVSYSENFTGTIAVGGNSVSATDGTTQLKLKELQQTATQTSDLADSHFQNTTSFRFSITYFT